jgi:polysaccharide pyruvyl transferase CsaB
METDITSVKNILIVGNYGAGNLGDDAILGGILEDLRAIGYSGQVQVTHGGFESSQDIYKGLKRIPFTPVGLRSSIKSLIKKENKQASQEAIRKADLVILGGGGLFTDAESLKAPIIWAKQAAACHKLGTPYICYGQSIGPLKNFRSRKLAKDTFKNAKAILVRDHNSKKVLADLGVGQNFEDPQITVGTDPAFPWLQANKQILKRSNALAISLRDWGAKKLRKSKNLEKTLQEIAQFAKKKKLKPILIAMDIRDQKEIKNLEVLATKFNFEFFEPPSARLAFQGIQKAKLAVTMRLHAGIFALAAATPLIAISYSSKVADLMRSLHINGAFRLINLENLTPSKLKKALTSVSKAKKPHFNSESPSKTNREFLAEFL